MPRIVLTLAVTLAVAPISVGLAGEALPGGFYEIIHRIELPHIESHDETRSTVCLTEVGVSRAFPVLSQNNPLARCPASNVRTEGRSISFEIACPGPNAAKAYGLFDILPGGFQGRIAMNMGGKNMTMTEVQRGARVGDCPNLSAPATH